jgi:hypothetical protein
MRPAANRSRPSHRHRLSIIEQETIMKKFILAAAAVLSLGVGSAFAAQTVTNHLGQVIDGPAYSSDAAGGG